MDGEDPGGHRRRAGLRVRHQPRVHRIDSVPAGDRPCGGAEQAPHPGHRARHRGGRSARVALRLNWIFIRPSDDFERKVDELVEAMDTDLDWVRAQSRLLVRAGEWERGQRDPSALLRGRELKDAEQWLLSCGQDSKRQATAQQIEYVVVSRQGENRRRTVALGATGAALVIAIALGIFAWWP